jgi:uncharacterized protein YjbJ (UPF0337 family)
MESPSLRQAGEREEYHAARLTAPQTRASPFSLEGRKSIQEEVDMGDRTQRVKGKANEVAGKAKGDLGYETGSTKTEAKGAAQTLKGKTQQTVGKARSNAKKATR